MWFPKIIVILSFIPSAAAAPNYDRDPDVIKKTIEQCQKKWSPEEEKKVGSEVILEYEKLVPPFNDPEAVARVQAIVNRISVTSDRPDIVYQVGILDDMDPNALAIPGGYVRVTRGLLEMVQSDDELAGVLSHEIAHCELYHGMRQMQEDEKWSKLQIVSILATVFATATGALDSRNSELQNIPWMVMLARVGWLSGYSRKYEYEADWSGMRYQLAAGYDPSGFFTFMQRMMNWEDARGWRRVPEDFTNWDSHPPTQERLLFVREFFIENHIVFNIAKVCLGFVATTSKIKIGVEQEICQISFGNTVIFQPSQKIVNEQTPEERSREIAEKINYLVKNNGIRSSYISSQKHYVLFCGAPIIQISPEDAELVNMTQSEYAENVVEAFRQAVYQAEQLAEQP